MSTTALETPCGDPDAPCATVSPPDNPFLGLHYHFGMLLGVDDLETEQGFHHGKMRLHNAWLHGAGVVWGLGVASVADQGELRVEPGLALDGAGRELHVDVASCCNVGAWYDAHEEEVEKTDTETGVRFDAYVAISYRACLTRPVPALADPCSDPGTGGETAFSRVYETVNLRLVPGQAPSREDRYHRLRVLFGVDAPVLPADQPVVDALEQPDQLLDAFRRFAALDATDLKPATAPQGDEPLLFPLDDDHAEIPLANVTVALDGSRGNWKLASAAIDTTVRPAHVATSTIQELLCGRALASADAGGPRVDRTSVALSGDAKQITFTLTKPLAQATVRPEAFAVSAYGGAGWADLNVADAAFDDGSLVLTLTLADAAAGDRIRVIAHGTGTHPLLGVDLVPLAGARGGPGGSEHDGHDFVHMLEGS